MLNTQVGVLSFAFKFRGCFLYILFYDFVKYFFVLKCTKQGTLRKIWLPKLLSPVCFPLL